MLAAIENDRASKLKGTGAIYLRVQIMADGRSRRYDGPRNFPPSGDNDVLQLRPTTRTDRLDVVRTIFRKYLDEATDYNNIAKYLNREGVPCNYTSEWFYHTVRNVLKNPCYTGRAAYNRCSGGRFHEFVDGERRQVSHDVNAESNRNRQQKDWVWSEELFQPVVTRETWERVQAKIGGIREYKRRAPKSPELWLAGLVYCAGCGVKMRGFGATKPTARQKRPKAGYLCATYAKTSASPNCVCERNSVAHEVVEGYVRKYLEESSQALDQIAGADDTRLTNKGYWNRHVEKFADVARSYNEMLERVGAQQPNVDPVWAVEKTGEQDLLALYRLLHAEDEEPLRNRFDELEEEHDRLTSGLINLPKDAARAVAKTQARLREVEQELAKVEGKMTDAAGRYEQHRDDFYQVGRDWQAALGAVTGEMTARKRAEAVRRIIGRIELRFEPTGKKHPKSELVAVKIIPLDGEALMYPTRQADAHCPSSPKTRCTVYRNARTTNRPRSCSAPANGTADARSPG